MLQQYIDLGWHTVPLQGKLERLPDGTKTIPTFEKGWKEKYSTEFNTEVTPLAGAISGEKSGFVAIDCDNTATFDIFRSLDPDYGFVLHSVGKGKQICGTFIYSYDADLDDGFKLHNELLSLDYYSRNGFIYLPTEDNHTKQAPASLVVKPMPAATKILLQQLQKQNARLVPAAVTTNSYNCLAPLVAQFNSTRKYMPGLFKILTPKDFRECETYLRHGHMPPQEVPSGRGSEYLSKVSAILGADVSINADMYVLAMTSINALFKDPMQIKRLESTILDPMLKGSANIDGVPIWKYDENWDQQRVLVTTKRQASLEMIYDDNRMQFYAIDLANEKVQSFSKDSDMMQFVDAVATNAPKKNDLKRAMPLANIINEPSKPFGFTSEPNAVVREFNVFKQTAALQVLHNPELFTEQYTEPTTILRFLESLVPEEQMREYLLKFLRHKLLTLSYSPVILYFMGVHGSGKDTFVNMLDHIIGNISKPTAKEFLEPYNSYMMDSFFVQLDEYGNQLQRQSDRDEALGKIKAYSGKPQISIRAMRTDGFKYNHRVTLVMTMNKNPLMLEDGDRRIAFFNTPNVLAAQPWVAAKGGIAKVVKAIEDEVIDFCYYLATVVEDFTDDGYVVPPLTAQKHELIADSMSLANKITYCCKHNQLDILKEMADEANHAALKFQLLRDHAYTTTLQELYETLTEGKGDGKLVLKLLRATNLPMQRTTYEGKHAFRINFTAEDMFDEVEEDE